METTNADVEPVTLTDVLELATWNRQRTSEELQNFVMSRLVKFPDDTELS